MKSSLPSMTKPERRRALIVKFSVGCIACYQIHGVMGTPANLHHIISEKTGRRISHIDSYGLCSAHHDRGPLSVHKAKFKFREKFGSDEYLLTETNRLIANFESNTIGGK